MALSLRRAHAVKNALVQQGVSVSAIEKTGLDQLARLVAERLGDGYVEATLETSVGNGRSGVFRHAYFENGIYCWYSFGTCLR